MTKILFGAIFLGVFLIGNVYAKQVAFCSGYRVSATDYLDCNGHIRGSYTPKELYEQGWVLKTSIPGANKFVLVFEKD